MWGICDSVSVAVVSLERNHKPHGCGEWDSGCDLYYLKYPDKYLRAATTLSLACIMVF